MPEGLAVNLPGNAIMALATLGFRDEIETLGRPIGRREYRTERDRLLFSVNEDQFWGADARPRGVRRDQLAQMLSRGIPDGVMHRGVGVRDLIVRHDHTALTLTDGSYHVAGLTVGADGVNSFIRGRAFGGAAAPDAALIAGASWRFMAPDPGIDGWTVWAGPRAMVLLMPVDGGEVYGWIAATKGRRGTDETVDVADLISTFPRRVRSVVEDALGRPGGLHHSPLHEVRLQRWTGHRVALIGDAAHATAPVWAQGVALAMEDASVLAECLTASGNIANALINYEDRRRPRVAHVQSMTDKMSKAARLPSFVRDLLMPFIGSRTYARTYTPLKEPA